MSANENRRSLPKVLSPSTQTLDSCVAFSNTCCWVPLLLMLALVLVLLFDAAVAGAGAVAGVGAPAHAPSGAGAVVGVRRWCSCSWLCWRRF